MVDESIDAMRRINARSLTSAVIHWLSNTHQPRLLHIFDHACNLINERREVLSIVTPEIGNGPFNLVVKESICSSEHLSRESPVSNTANQLNLGDLTIHISDAKLWDPQPDWKLLNSRKADIATQLLKLAISDSQFSNSLISSLSSALVNSKISTAKEIAAKIAGLGIGLTPSGDDCLMGALYAAWIIHPHEIACLLAREITETAAPLTTALSAAWLQAAGRGEVGILWHKFFDASVSGKMQRLQEATDKILEVGETSGADALFGFISVFTAYQAKELATHENPSR